MGEYELQKEPGGTLAVAAKPFASIHKVANDSCVMDAAGLDRSLVLKDIQIVLE